MKFTFTFSKRVYFLLSFVATLLTIGVSHTKADELTIYDKGDLSASSTYSIIIPMSGNYSATNQECEFIIPANKLVDMKGKIITSIVFYTYEEKTTNFDGHFKIFLKETQDIEKNSFDGDENASIVYEGNLTISSNQLKIDFENEYTYNGGNLLVGVYETIGGLKNEPYNFIGETLEYNSTYKATSTSNDGYYPNYVASGFIPKTTFTYSSFQKPKMTVYKDKYDTQATNGQTIDFGLVETAPTYKYYVKNTKKGVLTVNIDATGGYTVEPANMSLGAGDMEEVTITAPKGDSNGKITITGKDGEEVIGTFEVNYQGDVMDKENKFFEDFVDEYRAVNSTDLPGWDLDLSVTGDKDGYGRLMFYNSTIYEYANNDESKYMITPKLRIKNNADIMYFNAYGRNGSYDTKIIISYSKDKTTWNTIKTFSYSSFNTTKKTYSFNDIPSGDFYIKFEICDVAIDWVYGYTLAPETAAIELDETVAPEGLTTGTQDVNLKYTIKEGKWNTIALPFAVNDLSVFGTDVKAYAFTGYENNEIKFNKVESLEAGKPYVMYVGTAAEANGNFTFESVEITATEASESAFNGAALKATYAPIAKGSMTETWYGITPDGKIMKAGANASIKGFRAYMTLPENTDASSLKMMFDGDATGIYVIENNTKNNDAIYNINGQRVSNATKGIYIINGKKVIK